MAYDSQAYGDPMLVLQRKQEYQARKIKGCLGCEHKQTIWLNGEKLHNCSIKRWIVQNCKDYIKVENES